MVGPTAPIAVSAELSVTEVATDAQRQGFIVCVSEFQVG